MQISFTIILLCVGGALVWLLVADKLVRAFGLAGALSLIRYRTNMNDPKDNSMVLFAILFGMACGVHQYYTAAVGVVVLSALLIIMKAVNNKVRAGMPLVTGNGNGSGTAPAAGEGAVETKGGERPSALEDEDGVFESRAETDD